ncbi:MAG TPA: PA2779 family protein [Methylomirabilota bacterium]|jgi:hypothetical protein|nr:PA2779 family protein [Methylomirabilota bacterium]
MAQRTSRGLVAALLALVIGALPPAPEATAAPLPPGLSGGTTREADLARLVRVFETRVAMARLGALGLTPEAAYARLARLDDAELHRLAQALPEVGLGGEDERPLEEKLGIILLYVVAVLIFAGLLYFALSGGGF